MDLSKISAGPNPPSDLYAVIEIPVGGVPVKYELDKISGAMFVDRFLHTAMFYPGNYGLHSSNSISGWRPLRCAGYHTRSRYSRSGDPLSSCRSTLDGRSGRS